MVGMKVVLLVVLAMAAMCAGKEYEVKWDIPVGDNHYSAIQGKTYYVGDTLKFTYMQEMHNVVEVGLLDDYKNCTMTMPLSPEYADGQTVMKLDKAGDHYFICSIADHCSDGMNLKVLAVAHDNKHV